MIKEVKAVAPEATVMMLPPAKGCPDVRSRFSEWQIAKLKKDGAVRPLT